MARRKNHDWRMRGLAAVLLLALVAGGWGWWTARGWRPDRASFPVQGVLIGAAETPEDEPVDGAVLRGIGADFVYLEASQGSSGRDPRFAENLAALAEAQMRTGVVHAYDPCVAAEAQAANFVTIVPRDASMLPPAISLDTPANACDDPLREAGVESELTTFINQIENHTGQPVVLRVSSAFEDRYHIAARIDRNLWLERDYFQPDYAGRPWTLWTANAGFYPDGLDGAFRWVVLQP